MEDINCLELEAKYQLNESPYIMNIDANSQLSSILFSDSTQSLTIFDITTWSVSGYIPSCHKDTITSIQYSLNNSNIIHSASLDHSIHFYDLRSKGSSSSSTGTGIGILYTIQLNDEIYTTNIGLNDNLLAVGIRNEIHFYDLRNYGRSLGVYSDCHTDLVTKVQFHPTNPSYLLSGSEDGLICCFNTAVPPQHNAVVSIMNTECAVRDFGFFGSNENYEGIYAISTVETLSLWHYPSAQRLSSYPNIRTGLGVDYLVNCWSESSQGAADRLYLLSGTHSGVGFVHEITPSSIENRGSLDSQVPTSSIESSDQQSVNAGHNDTIRCVYPFGFHSKRNITTPYSSSSLSCGLISGGEDGALCLWRYTSNQPQQSLPISSDFNKKPSSRGVHHHRGQQQDHSYSKQLRYDPFK